MKCPACKTPDLVMSERQGVEIDYCPQCRGIWLDRGELDKILERSERETAPAAPQPPAAPYPAQPPTAPYPPHPYPHRSPDDSDIYPAQGGGYYKKRKSWLRELLD